jgi:hypothetical protein
LAKAAKPAANRLVHSSFSAEVEPETLPGSQVTGNNVSAQLRFPDQLSRGYKEQSNAPLGVLQKRL